MYLQQSNTYPIICNLSAGVGRTGTFIGLDVLIERLQNEQTVNVYDTVIEMRKQRTEMVQGLVRNLTYVTLQLTPPGAHD